VDFPSLSFFSLYNEVLLACEMKFPTLLLLASTASAQAIIQLLATLPACSINCLTAGLRSYNCAIRDVVCSCGYKDEISVAVTPCIKASCSVMDGEGMILLFLHSISRLEVRIGLKRRDMKEA
jgi:hypothetical protein